MRIYRRGKRGIYWCQWRGQRQSLHTADEHAAQLAFADLQRRAADPAYASAHATTLAAACEAFRAAYPHLHNRRTPPAAGTLEMVGYHLGHFVRLIGGDTPLALVDAPTVDRYVATRRREAIGTAGRTVGASTVRKELSTLTQVLRHAARQGHYHRPLEQVMPARVASEYTPLTRALAEDEIPRLLAALRPDRAAIAAFLVGLGADWCAVERARFEDFDFRARLVLVRGTKSTRRHAWVPMLRPFGRCIGRAARYLYTHGAFVAWANPQRDIAAACTRAGLPRVTPRDLRRTFGQVLRARGVSPVEIGALLRHADARMAITTYGQIEPSDLGRQVTARIGPRTEVQKRYKRKA